MTFRLSTCNKDDQNGNDLVKMQEKKRIEKKKKKEDVPNTEQYKKGK